MLTISIRKAQTIIYGTSHETPFERQAEDIYEIQKGQNTIQFNKKELDELKELINKIK